MGDNSQHKQTGTFKRISRNRRVIITTSVVMAAVPVSALALSQSAHSKEGMKSSHVSVTSIASLPAADIINTSQPTTGTAASTLDNTSSENNTNSDAVSVTVNGEQIDVPANGSITQDVPSANGDVHLNIVSSGNQTNSSNTSTSVTLQNSSNNNQTGGYSSSYSNVNVHSSH